MSPSPPPWSTREPQYRGPAHAAHGLAYWIVVGWWWEPAKFLGRVLLWLLVWPVGLSAFYDTSYVSTFGDALLPLLVCVAVVTPSLTWMV